MPNPLTQLRQLGQSIWLDFIDRRLLDSGDLARLVRDDGVSGLTSNPTIFQKAFGHGNEYDSDIQHYMIEEPGIEPRILFYHLAIADITRAADIVNPVYEQTDGADGYVSLEVSPDLADDAEGTVEEARRLFVQIDRPNVMIKVPGTEAGLAAFEELTSQGINVNVTLLFSRQRYEAVVDAYLRGLERRVKNRRSIARIASVASFFISRVDTAVDQQLETVIQEASDPDHRAQAEALRGWIAVSNAKMAYQHYRDIFHGPRFATLREQGANPQRLLWASTGTKNPDYSDTLYVEHLVGPETVNTLPMKTLEAFRDHGRARLTLDQGVAEAERRLEQLEGLGIHLEDICRQLETEGVQAFAQSFDDLLKELKSAQTRQARSRLTT